MNRILTTILNIGEEMLLSGAEISRVEESINMMGKAFGANRVDAFIITSSMAVTLHLPSGEAFTQTRRVVDVGTDIEKLHRLNSLSREICQKKITPQEAEKKFEKIKSIKPYPLIFQILSYALISSAFTLFFGGGPRDAACSFVIGAFLSLVFMFSLKRGLNKIFARFLASFFTALSAFGLLKLGVIDTVDYTIIGNIMTLIPGVGITVALRDLFVGDNISGLIRTIEALLFAVAIAGGYLLSAFIAGTTNKGIANNTALPILQVITGYVGALGFAVLYNIRGGKLVFASLGGLISWSSFLLLGFVLPNEILRYFIVSLLVSTYSEIMARIIKTPATTFSIISLIPLVPGSALYYTMTSAFSGNNELFIEKGIITVALAGSLAAGIILVAGFMKLVAKRNLKS